MKSFASYLRYAAAAVALAFSFNAVHAQTVYSDNFDSYTTTTAPVQFTSTFTFVSNALGNGMNPAMVYSVTNNLARNNGTFAAPVTQHPDIATSEANSAYIPLHPFYDNTQNNGEGLYLAINAGPNSSIYRPTNSIAVVPSTDYVFSVWMMSWTPAAGNFGRVEVRLEGDVSTVSSFLDAPSTDPNNYNTWGVWELRTFVFNSGDNTTINLDIINTDTEANGNDYGIDDISISVFAVPEPASIALSGLGAAGFAAVIYSKVRNSRRRKMSKTAVTA